MAGGFLKGLCRKKPTLVEGESKLARVLTLLDLTALGVGSTLGLGVYVLAGAVAKTVAGPAVCLSFLVAAVASAFAGLCYAEFAARVPQAGSAYVYSYVSVGEFVAFVIGWNLILEYVIGTASVASGLSNYIDALSGNVIKKAMVDALPINIDFLANHPDFLALVFVLILTALLAIGVKESTRLNNLFTALNLTTVIIVLISGTIKADIKNWKIPKSEIPEEFAKTAGDGGFMPFGIAGVMAGAAKCFYGFVGFDCVATTGEEAINPKKHIPLSIVISLFITFFAYFGISTVLTMMWPYYAQDADAPFPYVFEAVGWPVIKWIVTVGAIFALCTSLLGAMFPLPRVLYAMAKDGIIFKGIATVHPKTKTPLRATIISGLLSGLMATIFDLHQLIDMMSIGTLLAYTIVATCVLVLRYQEDESKRFTIDLKNEKALDTSVLDGCKQAFNLNMNKYPDSTSTAISRWGTALYTITAVLVCAFVIYGLNLISLTEPYYLAAFIVIVIVMIIIVIIIARQPAANIKLSFKVPWVPVIPCLSVLMNAYLMLELDLHTWIRFAVWLFFGFLIYFFYGYHHSIINTTNQDQMSTSDATTASVHSEKYVKSSHEKEVTRF